MKTLIKQSLIVTALCATLTGYASSVEPIVRVEESETKSFTLILNNNGFQHVQIFIKDMTGEVLHSENLDSQPGYFKKYNLKQLPQGTYSLEIEDDHMVKIIPFEVCKSVVTFDKNEESKVFKPYIRQRGQLLDVMFYGNNNNPAKVLIFDESGNLLQRDKFKRGDGVEKIYDFSQVPAGKYTVNLNSGDRFFSQIITF